MAEAQTPPAITPPATPPAGQTPPARPANVPEKFWDPQAGQVRTDALLTSYTELEKKLGGGQPTAPAGGGVKIPAAAPLGDDATEEQIIASVGLDMADVTKTFIEKGDLSAEQYEAFKKAGYPKALVKSHMAAKVKLAQDADAALRTAAVGKLGGEAQLANLLTWGKTNLSAQELDWYNGQAGNPASALMALDWLAAKHQAAVGAGKAAPLVEGGGPAAGVTGFGSQAEMVKAMSVPRYNSDPAYRKTVTDRLAKSDRAKVMKGL